MNKNEIFELVVKAFGVYLFVLAIIALPKVLESVMMLGFYAINGYWSMPDETFGKMYHTLQTTFISQSVGSIIRFVIYIIASVNFLRSGSWVNKLMGKKAPAEPAN